MKMNLSESSSLRQGEKVTSKLIESMSMLVCWCVGQQHVCVQVLNNSEDWHSKLERLALDVLDIHTVGARAVFATAGRTAESFGLFFLERLFLFLDRVLDDVKVLGAALHRCKLGFT